MIKLIGRKIKMTSLKSKNQILPLTLIKLKPGRLIELKKKKPFRSYLICYNDFYLNFYNPKNQKLLLVKFWKNLINNNDYNKIKKSLILINFYESEDLRNESLITKFIINPFVQGQFISISGKTIGKGFSGKIKKHNLKRGPMSHGSKHHRRIGSVGSGLNRILKNKKMPGQLGTKTIQIKNNNILCIDKKKNILYIKGSIPGKNNAKLELKF